MIKGYTNSVFFPARRSTREVPVGDVVVGGQRPVVIQSMTTPSTKDTKATVEQIIRLVEAGCEIVRVTTPTMADIENVPSIRKELEKRKVKVPLVADVHFLPQVALKACEYVEKVRINPGNFADRKRFQLQEYTDAQYQEELERVHESFLPIVLRAKEYGRAIRIGTNHGSLSDRIMNRFGDTPLGMVESALEFVKIAEGEGFKNIILSMKSSNTRVMIQAYRLLVSRMNELDMDYPLHLGVTEAGDGEDGRIKSAIGIGSLLSDGLGDTIRVSLTEDPVAEIPVAKRIIKLYRQGVLATGQKEDFLPSWDFYSYAGRESHKIGKKMIIGDGNAVRVRTPVREEPSELKAMKPLSPSPECLVVEAFSQSGAPERLKAIDSKLAIVLRVTEGTARDTIQDDLPFDQLSIYPSPAWSDEKYCKGLEKHLQGRPIWFRVRNLQQVNSAITLMKTLKDRFQIGIEIEGKKLISFGRLVVSMLSKESLLSPVHLKLEAVEEATTHDTLIHAATEIGSLLCDGIGDSVEIGSSHGMEFDHRLAFNILQAARVRMSKTEYIACPSCGRTLFDLQEVTARIRARTSHLKGVKIAIMGCIVNGPGEMADADFGYVGSGPGFINLYVGKECVERSVPEAEADERLINLIKKHDQWVDPSQSMN